MKCRDTTWLSSPHRSEAQRMGPGLPSPHLGSSSPSPGFARCFWTKAYNDVTEAVQQGAAVDCVSCFSVCPAIFSILNPIADSRPLGVGVRVSHRTWPAL